MEQAYNSLWAFPQASNQHTKYHKKRPKQTYSKPEQSNKKPDRVRHHRPLRTDALEIKPRNWMHWVLSKIYRRVEFSSFLDTKRW